MEALHFSNVDIILSFLSGIISAKYDLMSFFDNPKNESFYYCIFCLFSSIFIRTNIIFDESDTKIDFFIVPLFLLPITSLISKNNMISNL